MTLYRPALLLQAVLACRVTTNRLLAHGLDERLGQEHTHETLTGGQAALRTILGLLIIGLGYGLFKVWKKREADKHDDTNNTL